MTTQLHIGTFSSIPTEVLKEIRTNDKVRVKKATLGMKGYRESAGFNPAARYSHGNDAGAFTFITDDGKYVPYNYHQGISVYTID